MQSHIMQKSSCMPSFRCKGSEETKRRTKHIKPPRLRRCLPSFRGLSATFYLSRLPSFLCFFNWKNIFFRNLRSFGKEWRNFLVILIKLEQQFHYLRRGKTLERLFRDALCCSAFPLMLIAQHSIDLFKASSGEQWKAAKKREPFRFCVREQFSGSFWHPAMAFLKVLSFPSKVSPANLISWSLFTIPSFNQTWN